MTLNFLASSRLPLLNRDFALHAFDSGMPYSPHLALTLGDVRNSGTPVRIHSECLTGDVFGSSRCDCGHQLDAALHFMVTAGSGALLYLRQEGRGIGLVEKLRAYALQDAGQDTYDANLTLGHPADARSYQIAADILAYLGVQQLTLLTGNPSKLKGLQDAGLDVIKQVVLDAPIGQEVSKYLDTKRTRFGHLVLDTNESQHVSSKV